MKNVRKLSTLGIETLNTFKANFEVPRILNLG